MNLDAAKIKLTVLSAITAAIGFATAVVLSALQQIPISYGTASKFTLPGQTSQVSTTPYVSTASSTGDTSTATQQVSDTTRNWAGYITSGGTYSSVSGSWQVPIISANGDTLSADATWIGIGGNSSNDLIQVGTQNSVESGQVTTGSFYEQLPGTSIDIPNVSVNPGDSITASVKKVATDEWMITIADLSNGESYSNKVSYSSSQSSAEWVEEAPSVSGGIMPLDSFGSVTFTNGSTTEDSQVLSIGDSNAKAVTMDNNVGEALTNVSTLNVNGNGFIVSRTDASSSPSHDQYYAMPGSGWRRHEPGLNAWGNDWNGYDSVPSVTLYSF